MTEPDETTTLIISHVPDMEPGIIAAIDRVIENLDNIYYWEWL